MPVASASPAPGTAPIPPAGAKFAGIQPSGLDYYRELTVSAPAFKVLLPCQYHLSFQSPAHALSVESTYVTILLF